MMKSHFSRFLHITLSHTGIREMFTSSLSLSDLIGVSRSKQLANLFDMDIRVKPEYDDVMCKKRLKCDFIIKNLLKKLVLRRF